MRGFGTMLAALGLAVALPLAAGASAAQPPAEPAVPSPAADAPPPLFAALDGRTCRGAMTLPRNPGRDETPADTPLRMTWFRGADGHAWVDFTYGARAPVPRPVHATPDKLGFFGAYGQPFVLGGDADTLTGTTTSEEAAGTIRATCAPDPAAAASSHPLPPDPVRQYDVASRIDGQTYRLMLRIPAEPAPPGGFPVLYVLDGNYYFGTVSDEAQRLIAQRLAGPFVIVAIGFPTEDRGEQGGLRDRTLSLPIPGMEARYGGADLFLRALDEELRPFVAAHAPITASGNALYGHSFGALTALRELFRDPRAFACYALSSPSIWWGDQEVLADEPAFSDRVRDGQIHARVLITSAADEQNPLVLGGDKHPEKHRMVDNASALAARLAMLDPRQLVVSRVILPDEVHGSVPPVSSSRAIRFCFPPK